MNTFDNSKLRKYDSEVEKKWSNTKEYNEYKEKTKNYSKEKRNDLACEMTDIFKEFSICFKKKENVESVKVQNLVKTLQDFITKNYYLCTDEILASLGKMYVEDERFKNNIDKQIEGTAEYVNSAIIIYTQK